MMEQTLDNFVAFTSHDIRTELTNLRDIKAWAIASLGIDYAPGDRVEIVGSDAYLRADAGRGWYPYREALVAGQDGVAGELRFDGRRREWYTWVSFARTWTVETYGHGATERVVRTWRGPALECPAGYELPKYYPPEGKVKSFMFDVQWLRKVRTR